LPDLLPQPGPHPNREVQSSQELRRKEASQAGP